MTGTEARTATFETTVTATGNNTGLVVPDAVIAAKSAETRQRRIKRAVALFRAGKQR